MLLEDGSGGTLLRAWLGGDKETKEVTGVFCTENNPQLRNKTRHPRENELLSPRPGAGTSDGRDGPATAIRSGNDSSSPRLSWSPLGFFFMASARPKEIPKHSVTK